MQFVRNGPEVPDRLLQSHEDGKVVFFCGAGISYPAQLPGFGGLVKKIYEFLGEMPDEIEKTAIKAGQFDTAIGLLESRIVGGRDVVRRSLIDVLNPDLEAKNALETHTSLLTLAHCHKNESTRLITTNFDHIFEEIIENEGIRIEKYQAPLLPVPKNRWNGLVYLHGLLTREIKDRVNNHLVLSSGDFGLAYLNERWAARFISELFRNYTICFVGYSINDPILRYMMDALAADRLLGESTLEMFAFGSYSRNRKKEAAKEWKAKNVTPILYQAHNNHIYLHKTLRSWAKTYRDGVNGKERIIVEHAITKPQISTREDNFVGRVLWALSDPSGLPARRFAGNKLLDPAPSLDWLDIFNENRFTNSDLLQFGADHLQKQDEKLTFSLLNRPVPNKFTPYMGLIENKLATKKLDDILLNLSPWFTRHLNDPKLLIWLANQGGELNFIFTNLIEKELEYYKSLEANGKEEEIATILRYSKNAIPSPVMRQYWHLLLTGRIVSSQHNFELYQWVTQFKQNGLTVALKIKLRELLTPKISLRKFVPIKLEIDNTAPESVIDWELRLTSDHVHSALGELSKESSWIDVLPQLLDDFTMLLRDAIELKSDLGKANELADMTYISQPSISKHPQNRKFDDWTTLIELTRDAWIATAIRSPKQALVEAEKWQFYPYPIFRRLMFFAAAQNSIISSANGLKWLLSDNFRWLWSAETKREAIRLIVALGSHLTKDDLINLEQAIIKGPPNELFEESVELERLKQIKDHMIWLRLSKLKMNNIELSEKASTKLETLKLTYPLWSIATDERDEFPFWMGNGEEVQSFKQTPKSRKELAIWLKENPGDDWKKADDWQQRCQNNFSTTVTALYILAKEGIWPLQRWQQALQIWSDEKYTGRSWRYIAPILISAPNDILAEISHALGYWIKSIAKFSVIYHEAIFFSFCKRILHFDYSEIKFDDPIMMAINHPVGYVTQAILNWWFVLKLEDGQKIPAKINKILTELCDIKIDKYRLARVLLAANAITLFRVDPDWSFKHLLILFNWDTSVTEARMVWEGFLWTPRLYYPFLEAIKPHLLKTATFYEILSKNSKQQYAAFITHVSLNRGEAFTITELREIYRTLPSDGLDIAAEVLARTQESSAEQREEYWDNRILPFWRNIWPKSLEVVSHNISKELVRLSIASGNRFPSSLKLVLPWLLREQNIINEIHLLHHSKHCSNFPADALVLLDIIIDDSPWISDELNDCLREIEGSNSELAHTPQFIRLHQICKKHQRLNN